MADIQEAVPSTSTSVKNDQNEEVIEYGKQSTRMMQCILRNISQPNFLNTSKAKSKCKSSYLTGYLSQRLDSSALSESSGWEHPIDRLTIHYMIMNYYTMGKVVPTTSSLYSALAFKLPRYVDIGVFRNILVQMGYMWKKCGPKVWLVLEKPEITFGRYRYMAAIKKSRKGDVCFIGGGALLRNGRIVDIDESDQLGMEENQHRFLLVLRKDTIEHYIHVESFSEWTDWLLHTVMPELKSGTTIVFENSRYFKIKLCETPTINSLKIDMIKWLEYHNIPYADTMTKLELFTLVTKMTDISANMFVADTLLKSRGCQTLHIVSCIDRVSPVTMIKRFLEDIRAPEDGLSQASIDSLTSNIQNLSSELIEEFHDAVIKEEDKIISYDSQVEAIWDEIMVFMKKCREVSHSSMEIDNFLPTCNPYE
ncbi:unnamed protein product [Leptidea sinapis]|uniref:Uncharacterized protein n=1 Tax=Leptidea sinapis TaxID=189913 RepID=A0A5E4QRA1_9NEOP|nr:unnamed protein product [Leptidea sinapis]